MVDLKDFLEDILELPNIDIERIADLVGKEFEYGSKGPDKYDCYTLSQEVCKRYDIKLPDFISSDKPDIVHQSIIKGKELFNKLDSPKPLSIVTFRSGPIVHHVGVMLNFPYFIHILPKCNVVIERIDSLKWKNKIEGFYAIS